MNEEQSQVTRDEVRVRRAPKFSVFIILGAVLGLVATAILTALFPADPAIGYTALVGYFAIYGVSAGVLIGAILALLLDRRSSKRAATVTVEHTVTPAAPEGPAVAELPAADSTEVTEGDVPQAGDSAR